MTVGRERNNDQCILASTTCLELRDHCNELPSFTLHTFAALLHGYLSKDLLGKTAIVCMYGCMYVWNSIYDFRDYCWLYDGPTMNTGNDNQ